MQDMAMACVPCRMWLTLTFKSKMKLVSRYLSRTVGILDLNGVQPNAASAAHDLPLVVGAMAGYYYWPCGWVVSPPQTILESHDLDLLLELQPSQNIADCFPNGQPSGHCEDPLSKCQGSILPATNTSTLSPVAQHARRQTQSGGILPAASFPVTEPSHPDF